MKSLLLLCLVLLSGRIAAQTCVHVYTTDPAAGPPNQGFDLFHFSDYRRCHVLVPATVFQNVPLLIREVSVGVMAGWQRRQIAELTIRMGYSAVAQLQTTFAANITSPLQDVLVVRDHTWLEGIGPAWVPLGLQTPFYFVPGHGNVLIEIVVREAPLVESGGSNANGEIATSYVATAVVGRDIIVPTIGTATLAPRLRFCADHAETSLIGQSCAGSAGSTPLLGVTGAPVPGGQPTFWLSDAPAPAIALLAFGFDNRPPFPMDLAVIGAPGCRLYFPGAFLEPVLANNLGIGQHSVLVPTAPSTIGAILLAQYFVLDPPGNALGITSSNYARLLVGL